MWRLFLMLFLVTPPALGAGEPPGVFVSVVPLKTFVERIGAEAVTVTAMVGPGHNPHTYDPTPRQIGALAAAQLYIRVGVPFEDTWMARIRAVNPAMEVMDARTGLDLGADHHAPAESESHGDHHHDPEGHDPHVWTDPLLVKRMAAHIRDTLGRIDPANAEVFTANYHDFAAELETLDADIRALFAASGNRRFMVYHPAWSHFAARYGLTQMAIEQEGKEPGARTLGALIERAREHGVRVIFVQPQMDRRLPKRLAEEIDGRVVVMDPLAADYVANMRRAARLIAGNGTP
ncbi:MAG: zinc ABC transporter substrate-binding protein [Gammaproteobacteria bacterium]|nr:zinc ABC transporter substrate-binding protein [Gammaproteobacteria bacterium]